MVNNKAGAEEFLKIFEEVDAERSRFEEYAPTAKKMCAHARAQKEPKKKPE